ncbi:MAG: hypothetical protein BMS9Abin10_0847 [Gammaproteobacteria bacterium]|nr:MAG: hypothetical protein BMS9Abin10_0847 [Gammaproteobacteria bacterium]
MREQAKQVIVISQASTTNAGTASGNVDTLEYEYATIDVIMATSNVVSNNPSVLKLAESDDTVVSNFADITAFVGDGTGGWTIPNAVTQGNWGVKFNVDLRGRKRYLKVSVSPVTTQVITCIANLFRGDVAPVNTTDANVKALVEG